MPVHRLNPTLDWPVDTVVKRALSKKPEDRYPTCSDFAFAVENACRTSKGWKPISAGSVQNLPTLTGAAPPVRPAVAPSRMPEAEVEESAPPRVLRWARNLALTVLAAVFIGAAFIGASRWLNEEMPEPIAGVVDETVAPQQATRPSAVPQTPAAESPGVPATDVPPPTNPEPTRPNLSKASLVRLVTNPPGAKLVVDGAGDVTCTAPCSLELTPGRHTIAATMEGYRRTLRIFEAPADRDIFLNLDRTSGNVIVRSEPRGATIVVDGQTRSEKTPVMLTLPTGRHTIEVIQDNQREAHEVIVREAVIANLTINLVDR